MFVGVIKRWGEWIPVTLIVAGLVVVNGVTWLQRLSEKYHLALMHVGGSGGWRKR